MNKAFTRESDYDAASDIVARPREVLPAGVRNYITPAGAERLRAELRELNDVARLAITERLSALVAGGRGDQPEHADAKRHLREVDAHIAWLGERLQGLEVVEPASTDETIRFGAQVTVQERSGAERTWHIVGIDEANPAAGAISWISPIAHALLGKEEGDEVFVQLPRGRLTLQVLAVRYGNGADASAADSGAPDAGSAPNAQS